MRRGVLRTPGVLENGVTGSKQAYARYPSERQASPGTAGQDAQPRRVELCPYRQANRNAMTCQDRNPRWPHPADQRGIRARYGIEREERRSSAVGRVEPRELVRLVRVERT